MSEFTESLEGKLPCGGVIQWRRTPVKTLYGAVGAALIDRVKHEQKYRKAGKIGCYFSAEYMLGRVVYSNLYNLGLLGESGETLAQRGVEPCIFEKLDDIALGATGRGRLAACMLESAATQRLPLDGYGIRYKYGYFKQVIENGFQRELPDDWQQCGDPFSVRREEEREWVQFGDQGVWAVPYDMPIIGFGNATPNTLRLWQAEEPEPFDFAAFNKQQYDNAYRARNEADSLHSLVYPSDDTDAGKRLRLKQYYFFTSASIQSILRNYKEKHGDDFSHFAQSYAIHLNDAHPALAIPELIRLLVQKECFTFGEAVAVSQEVFSYTNYTLAERNMQRWDAAMFAAVLPEVWPYVVMVNDHLRRELKQRGVEDGQFDKYSLITGRRVHTARMAAYISHDISGIAPRQSELAQNRVLKEWHALYPKRFSTVGSGITQRRWVGLCNPELSGLLTELVGENWVVDLELLEGVKKYAGDARVQQLFREIKRQKKVQLEEKVTQATGVRINPDAVLDVQVREVHECNRQLLNVLAILDIYYRIKDGELKGLPPVTLLFGGKAAANNPKGKAIIKLMNEVARVIAEDPEVCELLQVVFVPNYNVSWAEEIIPAADMNEQLPRVGTELFGTGSMKFMLNGAVTLGSLDGLNPTIFEAGGHNNNYAFGPSLQEAQAFSAEYDPDEIYRGNPRLRRVINTITSSKLDDNGTGAFAAIRRSLLKADGSHRVDPYFVLADFEAYTETKLRALRDSCETEAFAQKGLFNIAGACCFSIDKPVRQYAENIWHLDQIGGK